MSTPKHTYQYSIDRYEGTGQFYVLVHVFEQGRQRHVYKVDDKVTEAEARSLRSIYTSLAQANGTFQREEVLV